MKYERMERGIFLERPNRFLARVRREGTDEVLICHVKNTGRCRSFWYRVRLFIFRRRRIPPAKRLTT